MQSEGGRQKHVDELQHLIASIDSEAMREALSWQSSAFAREMVGLYLDGNAEERAEIRAFFACEGPRVMHEAKLRHEDGTPTSADIRRWIANS